MGLLEKLWDDTVAGPRPDSGLGKLRKYDISNFRSVSGKEMLDGNGGNGKSYGDEATDEAVKVTRKIMIVKPPEYNSNGGSQPASPAGTTPPVSPFSGSRQSTRLRRRSTSDAYEKASEERTRSSAPT